MQAIEYVAPASLDEAVGVLAKHGELARVLAGGTDVIIQAREGRRNVGVMVDVKAIPEMTVLALSADGSLRIGAATACARIYGDAAIAKAFPALIDSAALIGGIQIQSRASLGGNLCNASPSADSICPMIVHSGVAVIAGATGTREVAVENFCTAPGKSVVKPGELLVKVQFPKPAAGFGAAYERFIPRNEMDIAVVGVASSVVLDSTGKKFKSARIALAAVGPTPIFAKAASDYLAGKTVSAESIAEAASMARDAAKPITDMRGTIDQRKQLVEVLTRRTLNKAVARAKGK